MRSLVRQMFDNFRMKMSLKNYIFLSKTFGKFAKKIENFGDGRKFLKDFDIDYIFCSKYRNLNKKSSIIFQNFHVCL